jgi:hypothetical protein
VTGFDSPDFRKKIVRQLQASLKDLPPDVALTVSDKHAIVRSTQSPGENTAAQRERAALRSQDLQNDILEAERDRVQQQKGHRTKFFVWAIIAVSAVLIFGGCMFVWHMNATNGKPADVVIVSWMSTSIVEVVGLGYIIARSLFEVRGTATSPVSEGDAKATGQGK